MKWLILGLLVIIALMFFPTWHLAVGTLDMTDWIPLNAMIVTMIPYVCVGLVVWFVAKNK